MLSGRKLHGPPAHYRSPFHADVREPKSHDRPTPLPIHPKEIPHTQNNLHPRRTRRRQPHPKQGNRHHPAHQKRYRNPHSESTDDSLHHHKQSLPTPIKIPDHTKHHRNQQTVNGIRLQILRRSRNNLPSLAKIPDRISPWKNAP